MLPSSFTHPLVLGLQKKSLPGVGGVFLTRGKREVEALERSEATARQAGEVVQQEVMALARKNKSGTSSAAAQQQRLMQQQCNVSGGFGGRQVSAVALVATLAMALAEQ
jgi:hypothetical protein